MNINLLVLAAVGKLTFFELLVKGSWLMIPIALSSILAVYVVVERYMFIKDNLKKYDHSFLQKLNQLIKEEKIDSAIAYCNYLDNPESRIVVKGIRNIGKPISNISESMEMEGKLEVYKYEKNLYILALISGIAPMFGFIGTISGVIRIFYNISLANNINISLISGGLYEKMITSAAGLSVGIIAFISYHWLNNQINKNIQRWEFNCVRFIDMINSNPL
jgi:biopolymer transport protein ExbB